MNALQSQPRVRGPIEFQAPARTEMQAGGEIFMEDKLELSSPQQGDSQSLSFKRASQVKSGMLVYSDESSTTSQSSQGCSSPQNFQEAPKTPELNVYIHNV